MTTATATPTISSYSQWKSLSRAEFTLLRRNSLQLFYALIMPLLAPFIFRGLSEVEGVDGLLTMVVTMIALFGLVFVAYYNPLSALVNRREESVLQRLRAGEVSDRTILVAMATPGFTIGLLMALATIAISVPVLNLDVPANIPLLVVTLVVTACLFILMAGATAAYTRTAESAQITSMPFIMIVFIGAVVPLLNESSTLYQVGQFLPTAPIAAFIEVAWFGNGQNLGQPTAILVAWIVIAAATFRSKFRWAKRN